MAADLHIHVMENVTIEDLALFFSNSLGSRWFNPISMGQMTDRYRKASERVMSSPSVWVGEVSWLKAAIFEDPETFVPPTVQKISEMIGESLPIIDSAFIEAVRKAWGDANQTSYKLALVDDVVVFLEKHEGQQAFTVSW